MEETNMGFIPHCEKHEIFKTLIDRANPNKGWKCPKCEGKKPSKVTSV